MGQFTEGEIIIEAKSKESADTIAEQIKNLDEYLKTKLDEPFHTTSITDVDADGGTVYVKLCSDRYPNLIWQLEQVFEMCKDLFKGDIDEFTGDYISTENHLYENFNEL